jgi:hypothetical protein
MGDGGRRLRATGTATTRARQTRRGRTTTGGSVGGVPKPPRRADPEPMTANEVLVIGVGTGLWLLAFVVLLPFKGDLDRHGAGWWLWVCIAGFGLGLMGLRMMTRRRSRARRSAAERPPTGPPPA